MTLKWELNDGERQFVAASHKREKKSKNWKKILVQISQTNS